MAPERSTTSGRADNDRAAHRRIVGYYAGWTNASKRYTPADIPAEQLTHVNYAFGLIDASGRAVLFEAVADVGSATPMDASDPGALGGVMIWELSGDDRQRSLLTAISSRLLGLAPHP